MSFKYRGHERTIEDVERRARQSGGAFDSYLQQDVSFFKPREGENIVRIMQPTWKDTAKWGNNWEIQVYMHRNVGPDNSTYLCLDKLQGERCPPCEARRRTTDEDESSALRPAWRALCWVIDRNNEKAGPQVWGLPLTLFREINARSQDKKTQSIILLDDPEEGFDLLFTREGAGIHTKYIAVEVDRDPTPLHNDEKKQAQWIKYIEEHPLPDMLIFYDADYIEKVLHGEGGGQEDRGTRRGRARGEVAEDPPSSRRSGRRAETETEEDTEPPPRSRRRIEQPTEEVEDPPFEGGRTASRRGVTEPDEEETDPTPPRRRVREPEPEAEPEDKPPPRRRGAQSADDAEDPTSQAKRQLGRLRERATR